MNPPRLIGAKDGASCCVAIDNFVQTFTVQIRSLSGVGVDSIKDQLQKKWEVTHIEQTDNAAIVR